MYETITAFVGWMRTLSPRRLALPRQDELHRTLWVRWVRSSLS